jgi:hypothetical protein
VHRHIITRENEVLVDWGELGSGDRMNDICEEILLGRLFFDGELCAALFRARVQPQVAKADIPFRGRVDENVRTDRVVLDMSNHFGKLIDM